MFAFFIYLGCTLVFFVLAFYAWRSQKPVGIWANAKSPASVSNVHAYNRAAAKLFAGYGVVLILCGLPMLFDAHPAVILLVSVLGMMLATIAMILAAVKIEQKYKAKR